jgi:hypothetical protein
MRKLHLAGVEVLQLFNDRTEFSTLRQKNSGESVALMPMAKTDKNG